METDLKGTFHRRQLHPPAISFCEDQGRKLFRESLLQGTLESYFPLSEQFITQGHPAFCGIGSLTMALNSLLLDPKRVWQGVWRWFDESMLDCCEPHDVVKLKGLTVAKVACLARCNGAKAIVKYGIDTTEEEFRQDIKRISSQTIHDCDREVMILSYNRSVLNQTGTGHFSPIGGYHEFNDMVLIMDVARFKYPPHWVPVSQLYQSIKTVDEDSGHSRGYILVSKSKEENSELFRCCRQVVCSSEDSDIDNNSNSNDNNNGSVSSSNHRETGDERKGTGFETSDVIHDRIEGILSHVCPNCKY